MAARKTPETLTAVARAATLARNAGALPPLSIAPKPSAPTMTRTEARNAADLEKARANLGQMGRPSRPLSPSPTLDPRADMDDSFSVLPIGDVEPYEHNPRTGPNPRYNDIRVSIMADGITNPITVTRRPDSYKYHPYGGGNTRLAIAKELHANGDTRFDTIKVIVKRWPGDANVISAHLAENEMRGDITFWEKAQGVSSFKRAHEQEHGVVLSTGDLGRELKSHGINFGVKVIQNFAFAVENLSPIGPWLKATEVNELIRPGMAGAMAVATCFGHRSFGDISTPVLLKYRDEILAIITYNKQADEEQRKVVELDATELVSDLHEALAAAIGAPPEVIPLMISAVESNSRITAEELKAIQIRRTPESSQGGVSAPAASPPSSSQRTLGGMLGGVAPSPQPLAPAGPPASPPAPTPPVHGSASSAHNQVPVSADARQRNPALPENVSSSDPTAHILSLVLDISDVVGLSDCILHVKGMPFGYCMDIPAAPDKIGRQSLPEPHAQVRAAAWKFLASVSGQLDPKWFTHVGADESNWTRSALAGPTAFRQAYEGGLRGFTSETGDPAMLLVEVYHVFNLPELGYLTVQLLRAMEQLRLDHPERFVGTVTSDPDFPG